jgi:hypothetical protein
LAISPRSGNAPGRGIVITETSTSPAPNLAISPKARGSHDGSVGRSRVTAAWLAQAEAAARIVPSVTRQATARARVLGSASLASDAAERRRRVAATDDLRLLDCAAAVVIADP